MWSLRAGALLSPDAIQSALAAGAEVNKEAPDNRRTALHYAAAVGDADFFPALLRYGAVRGRAVKQALKTAAKSVAKQPELIEFLIEEGLESELTPERAAAKLLLGDAPAELGPELAPESTPSAPPPGA